MKINHNYISFESVIGTGKTYLTKKMSDRFASDVMYEIVEENPFLEKFYQDPDHWAFQTECFFLCNRYMQLKKVKEVLSKDRIIIGDYHILKNMVFAELTLKGEELEKYSELYQTMIRGFEVPGVIVYSKADLQEVKRRIRKRGRKIEKDISDDYLTNLINAYDKIMNVEALNEFYPGTRLIEIDANNIDFIETPERLNELYECIKKAIELNGPIYQEMV